LVYVFPILILAALGTAFRSRPIERFMVTVQESTNAKRIAQTLGHDERFMVKIASTEEARALLRVAKADVVIVPVAGSASNEYHYDPTQPRSMLARNAADDLLQRAAGRKDAVEIKDVEVSEKGGRYIDFLVPGLLGMSLLGGGLWGVGFAIVDMRIRKLLKRLVATPMKRSHFLGGMMLSRLLFLLPEMVAMLLFAWLVYGVVNYGSWLSVIVLLFLGATTFAGIGLLVGSRAQTLETASGLMNLVMLPMWIFGGIFFSPDRFPDFLQPFIQALPLTPLISALRSVMLEGASLASQWQQILILVCWSTVSFALALRLFRWR
jgi:ABC-type multidrug transport system permease subunit